MARNLDAVPALRTELDATLARWDTLTVASGRGGDPGLPYRLSASLAIDLLRSTVGYWAQTVRRGPERAPTATGPAAVWLCARLDWLRALEGAGDAYHAIHHAVDDARRAIDYPTHRARFAVGPCPVVSSTGGYCPGDVWAYIPSRVGVEPALLRCLDTSCRRHRDPWTTDQWLRAGRDILRRMGSSVHSDRTSGGPCPATRGVLTAS